MGMTTLPGWAGMITGAAAAGVAASIGYAPELVYLMDVHPGVAGWVQAVGSVAAILVSAGLAIWIGRSEERRRRVASAEAQVRALNVIASLAFNASNAISAGLSSIPNGPAGTIGLGHEVLQLESARDAIDRLPLATLDVPVGAIASILELRGHLIQVHGIIEKTDFAGAFRPMVEQLHHRSRQICDSMVVLCNEASGNLRRAVKEPF